LKRRSFLTVGVFAAGDSAATQLTGAVPFYADNKLVNRPDPGTSAAVAEGWANVAQAAANNNLVFATEATVSWATIDAGITVIETRGSAVADDGLGRTWTSVGNGSKDTITSNGGARTWWCVRDVSADRLGDAEAIKEHLDPSEQVITGEGLKLNYHKARGAWHVKAFGSSLTSVGADNASVDTAALQSAMSSGQTIDLTGVTLHVDDTISVINESAKIGTTIESIRPSGEATSCIIIDDDDLPVVFQVGHDNFEASGFCIRGSSTNVTTTAFWFERTVDTYRDIDARVINMGINRMGRAALIKGRGLEFSGNTVSDMNIAAIEMDQPASWTPRGSASIDGPDTGTRGFRFNNNRAHAMNAPFVLNAGTYALNIGGIEINGLIADVGANGGLIKGVMIDLVATGIQCRYSLYKGSRIVELQPGSRNCCIMNFNAAGYMGTTGNRLADHGIRMTSSAANPIRDIFFIGGTIGPTLESGANFIGDGAYDNICFTNVVWQRIGQQGSYSPIQIGADVTSAVIKLVGTHGRDNCASVPFLTAYNMPSNVTLIRDVTATKDASFSAWATDGVQPTST